MYPTGGRLSSELTRFLRSRIILAVAKMTALKRTLQAEGRKQVWLAGQIGKHESEVSRIVNGFIPDDATRQAIAQALGRTVEELFPADAVAVAA